jgi:hypothetical protein
MIEQSEAKRSAQYASQATHDHDCRDLTDDELVLIVGGGDEDIKGDITVNPK